MNVKLKNILSIYAGLWADVLYNRRLSEHLQQVENDILFVRLLIMLSCFGKQHNAPVLIKIKIELIRMRKIIRKRIAAGSLTCLLPGLAFYGNNFNDIAQ
jgi:hypothetical protein